MLDILIEKLGLAPWIASYVLLPVLFFAARILDVSFSVINRERLPKIFEGIKTFNPNAFYTVESGKSATDNEYFEAKPKYTFFNYLSSKRK